MASPVFNGMANFQHLHGIAELEFSFLTPASGAVTTIRDSKGAQVASVSAYTSGIYTVTFNSRVRMPRQLTSFSVGISQPSAGTGFRRASLVTGSLDVSARTVQILITDDTAAVPGAVPPTGSQVSVSLRGPYRDDLKDPA